MAIGASRAYRGLTDYPLDKGVDVYISGGLSGRQTGPS
jgi:hypothetical protein